MATEVRSIGGGWHDAGNLCQGSYRTDLAVFALLRLYEQLTQRACWPELQLRVLEEARWGLTWLRQSRFAPGWRITQASFNMYTDGVVRHQRRCRHSRHEYPLREHPGSAGQRLCRPRAP